MKEASGELETKS